MRRWIEQQVIGLTGLSLKGVNYREPIGDLGLYGPDSMVWRVHSDFTCMLCGGISALLLQMLEPKTLAGVWDHSNFRDDMLGRLRRTGQFIAATSFGPRDDALALVDKVRRIHDRVTGFTADGRPYAANDPQLLTWVHVTEVRGFLMAYLRYKGSLTPAEQDRYFDEVAQTARLLGADNVPTRRVDIDAYIEEMRPQLMCDERTREVRDILMTRFDQKPQMKPMLTVFMSAGLDLLPPWAAQMLENPVGRGQRIATRASVKTTAHLLRWAVRDGASFRARQRVGASFR